MTTTQTQHTQTASPPAEARPEVHALKYSSRQTTASGAFYRHDLYQGADAEDTPVGLDYFFWLVRSPHGTVVVDCGFTDEVAAQRNRTIQTQPAELLARMGVDPKTVDHLVLSHMHFDHVGNIDLFPNATVHIARAEHDYWTGRHSDVPAFSWPVERHDVDQLGDLAREGRLALTEDQSEIMPGVRLLRFPGHTPGQLVTDVAVGSDRIMIASDAVHYYDELRNVWPNHLFTDMEQLLDSYAELRALDARPDVDLIPGHDALVGRLYDEVEPDCFDLTKKVAPAS
jgi:glyoxylase-like metal-dependent hydrolase (beta-lactamase superfamily II)